MYVQNIPTMPWKNCQEHQFRLIVFVFVTAAPTTTERIITRLTTTEAPPTTAQPTTTAQPSTTEEVTTVVTTTPEATTKEVTTVKSTTGTFIITHSRELHMHGTFSLLIAQVDTGTVSVQRSL